jgi:hypothetical protein
MSKKTILSRGWIVNPGPHHTKLTGRVAEKSTRVCLRCRERFESVGKHNRLCEACALANSLEPTPRRIFPDCP